MTFGSLFAGIGGLDLGLERAGMRCAWQVEIDPYCRRVLAKHWPHVRRWDDVRTFPPGDPAEWACDLVAGGFPCQPVSQAGRRECQQDARWLWPEFARVLCVLRPRFALLENVPDLLVRGFGDVLRELAEGGFDAEWDCLPAAAFGAPTRRTRLFLVAYRHRSGREGDDQRNGRAAEAPAVWPARWPYADGLAAAQYRAADAASIVQRMDPRVPARLDRLRCLGNAVVPQVAEWIGRCIVESYSA